MNRALTLLAFSLILFALGGCGTSSPGGSGGQAGSGLVSQGAGGTDIGTTTAAGGQGQGGTEGGSGPGGAGGAGGDTGPITDGGNPIDAPGGGNLATWPQAAGPNATWRAPINDAPVRWSVAANQNVLWKGPLPNEGQGGIAVWGDRLFLETFEAGATGTANTVLGHAIDRANGKILWSVKLVGDRACDIAYGYSDCTSWTPITDGTYVWFFNSSGEMGCWDLSGKEIWRRKFPTQPMPFPFNRQHEPILVGDTILSLEPLTAADPGYRADRAVWNYLRGLDKMTGKTRWIAEDASTFFNTPVAGRFTDGTPAVLHGRGGPHGVPEAPIGITMTSLAPGQEGKTLWRYEPAAVAGGPVDGQTFHALYTMSWDEKYAYWFRNAPEESHLVFDARTGKLLRTQSLIKGVDWRQWDVAKGQYVLHANVNVRDLQDPTYPLGAGEVLHVLPHWHSNIADRGYHYFFASTNNTRAGHFPSGHAGPPHCIGRVNVETGKVEYLEVPVGVERAPQMVERLIYGKTLTTTTNNAQGQDIAGNDRSHHDGWADVVFVPNPISLGGHVYMGAMLGVTYVIDGGAAVFDEHALLAVNDLGPLCQTWSLSGPSYAGGILYHRSLKEVVALRAP